MKKKREFENDMLLCSINCSNRADREKDKSFHRFPSIVKNNSKEGLKTFESEKGKVVNSNFQEIFN